MVDLTTEKTAALAQELRTNLKGEVLFDRISRVLYSSDASNYQIEPLGVVIPRHVDEICATIEIAREFSVPVIARGSGSSMAGQTLGSGLILDCSKYLNEILDINVEERTATVGPGVILENLNQKLSSLGLAFGPDPASAERATLGGMLGNNATGAHSIRYGLVIDHVLSAEVVLSDGTVAKFEKLSEAAFAQRQKQGNLEGAIYTRAAQIRNEYEKAVRERWPRTWRRASGYSLNYLTGYSPGTPPVWYQGKESYPPTAGFNLTPLLVGSEGTLAILRNVKLNLVQEPLAKVLAILAFNSVAEAADATPGFLETNPDAIELIPRSIFERARTIPAYARKMNFLDADPATILVLEYSGSNLNEALAKARNLPNASVLEDPKSQADLWAVRKVGLGLLMSIPGDLKPITFIEDVAVPVQHLGEYVRQVERVLGEHATYGEWYAHASAGCLHLRPMVNLKTAEGVRKMHDIAEAVIEITLQLQGSISGEHGDGLSHTEYNERLFGPELTRAFREIKDVFDPDELLNPGKVIPAKDGFGGEGSLTSHLRYGPDYQPQDISTLMVHHREGGFIPAVEACTGVGVCRQEHGLMCPSYQATRDEIHTTRGRANALRAALSGILPPGSLTSAEMYEVLDLCLECKGCKAECPTAVDMARIKAEFLHMYQSKHGTPIRSRIFGHIHKVSAALHPVSGLLRRISGTRQSRWLQETVLGITRYRSLPELATQSFRSRYHPASYQQKQAQQRVILFVDTYTNFMHPQLGLDALSILDHLGYQVSISEEQVCCGRPMISKGLLDEARSLAAKNIKALGPMACDGAIILGLEPSCLLTFRDEYLEFFPESDLAQGLARQSMLFEEFLLSKDGSGERPIERLNPQTRGAAASLHNHCYSKALVGSDPLMTVLEALDIAVSEIPSGCCGMAGSFGYEEEHYDLSMQIAEDRLLPGVREAVGNGHTILAPGFSCRTQIRDGTGICAIHPVEYIASLIHDA